MADLSQLRELSKKYRRWNKLEQYIDRLETVYSSDLENSIINTYSLIETILKTILCERNEQYKQDDKKLKNIKTSQLVGESIKSISMVNSEQIAQFINGLQQSLKSLGLIRGNVAHGKDLSRINDEKISELTLLFLIKSVENIACFLIDYYELEYPLKQKAKEPLYEDYDEFNKWLDNEYGMITVTEYPIETSVALFTDPIAYQTKYQEYLSLKNGKTN